jgi:hypothetical protein
MKSDSYERARDTILTSPNGQTCCALIARCAATIGGWLCAIVDGSVQAPEALKALSKNRTASMAIWMLGRATVDDIIEKNLTLVLARLLQALRQFDSLSVHDRTQRIIELVPPLSPVIDEWKAHLDQTMEPIHDKKKRRQQRHEHLTDQSSHEDVAVSTTLEQCVHHLFDIVLPEGASSIYLPMSTAVFKEKLQGLVSMGIPIVVEKIHAFISQRMLKMHGLFSLYSSLYRWVAQEQRRPPSPSSPASPQLVTILAPAIHSWICAFTPHEATDNHEIPFEALAQTLIDACILGVKELSLTALVIQGVMSLETMTAHAPVLHTEAELQQLIEQMGRDERIVRCLLKKCADRPDLPIPKAPDVMSTFLGLLIYGLQESASDIFSQEALRNCPWQEWQHTVLTRFEWFTLSPYGDRAVAHLMEAAVRTIRESMSQ